MSIVNILNSLAATTSRNEKERILTNQKDNQLLKDVLVATYNPFINYYIAQIPPYTRITKKFSNFEWALNSLDLFSSRSVTGNAAIQQLQEILSSISDDDADIIERIIQRDLRCGVNESTINKVWPGLIPTFDVMLAHKDISGIKYPCYGQIKFDGARCHMVWDGNTARAFSRNGKEITTLGVFDDTMSVAFGSSKVTIDGELLVVRNGVIQDRKTGNGIINKANKGTINESEADELRMVAWDIVDATGTRRYDDRLQELGFCLGRTDQTKIMVAETRVITSPEDAQKMFEECLAAGHEGAMMKNMDQKWEPKRVKGIGKMKAEEEADLRVVDVLGGTGKYLGMIGALVCETEDGLLSVNVGTGLSDADRSVPASHYLNKIITVLYNQKITSKGKEKASLFLPRFVEIRTDKNVANKLEELK